MIGAIIQARMGSTRLPNKVMYDIEDKKLLQYCIERISMSKYIDKVVVATTEEIGDDIIYDWCTNNRVLCFRGSESDVLDRYYKAALEHELDIVIRVTSDCPFVDPVIIDMLITTLLCQDCNYVSNRWKKRSWPHGLDVEVMQISALKKAWESAHLQYEREHVTPYILEHQEVFKIMEVPFLKDLSHIRLTVDYQEDLDFVKQILPKLYNEYGKAYGWQQIIEVLKQNPELQMINSSVSNPILY